MKHIQLGKKISFNSRIFQSFNCTISIHNMQHGILLKTDIKSAWINLSKIKSYRQNIIHHAFLFNFQWRQFLTELSASIDVMNQIFKEQQNLFLKKL